MTDPKTTADALSEAQWTALNNLSRDKATRASRYTRRTTLDSLVRRGLATTVDGYRYTATDEGMTVANAYDNEANK